VQYVKIGVQVTLVFAPITATSNATTFTLTGLPASLTPAVTADVLIPRLNNGVYGGGAIRMTAASTTMTLYAGADFSAWTASGNKGIAFMAVTYICQ
jgi:hypothetical protein